MCPEVWYVQFDSSPSTHTGRGNSRSMSARIRATTWATVRARGAAVECAAGGMAREADSALTDINHRFVQDSRETFHARGVAADGVNVHEQPMQLDVSLGDL